VAQEVHSSQDFGFSWPVYQNPPSTCALCKKYLLAPPQRPPFYHKACPPTPTGRDTLLPLPHSPPLSSFFFTSPHDPPEFGLTVPACPFPPLSRHRRWIHKRLRVSLCHLPVLSRRLCDCRNLGPCSFCLKLPFFSSALTLLRA